MEKYFPAGGIRAVEESARHIVLSTPTSEFFPKRMNEGEKKITGELICWQEVIAF